MRAHQTIRWNEDGTGQDRLGNRYSVNEKKGRVEYVCVLTGGVRGTGDTPEDAHIAASCNLTNKVIESMKTFRTNVRVPILRFEEGREIKCTGLGKLCKRVKMPESESWPMVDGERVEDGEWWELVLLSKPGVRKIRKGTRLLRFVTRDFIGCHSCGWAGEEGDVARIDVDFDRCPECFEKLASVYGFSD